jgi:hypothetical protein
VFEIVSGKTKAARQGCGCSLAEWLVLVEKLTDPPLGEGFRPLYKFAAVTTELVTNVGPESAAAVGI